MKKAKEIMDEIFLRTELAPNLSPKDADQVKARLRENLKVKTNLSFLVEVKPQGSLPRYMLKAKCFKDKREIEKNERTD